MAIAMPLLAVLYVALSSPEADDVLKSLVARADMVIVAEVGEPIAKSSEVGVAYYTLHLNVQEVLKGQLLKEGNGRSILATFGPFSYDGAPFFLRKGDRCLVFLKTVSRGGARHYIPAESWLSIQPYNRIMAKAIRQ